MKIDCSNLLSMVAFTVSLVCVWHGDYDRAAYIMALAAYFKADSVRDSVKRKP